MSYELAVDCAGKFKATKVPKMLVGRSRKEIEVIIMYKKGLKML
jgi:hypothetical protein